MLEAAAHVLLLVLVVLLVAAWLLEDIAAKVTRVLDSFLAPAAERFGDLGAAWQRLVARGVSEVDSSCCWLILVDQSTEDVAATQPAEVRRTSCFGMLRRHRRCVGQAAVCEVPPLSRRS